MKNIILTLAILVTLSCKAQSPIVSFTDYCENDFPYTENMYIKDIEGLLTPYIGTWKWELGNSMIIIEMRKEQMEYYSSSSTKRYRDKLKATMKYVDNGITIFDTLLTGEDVLSLSDCVPINGEYRFSFKDPIKPSMYGKVFITLNDFNTEINFYLRNNEGIRVLPAGQTTYDAEFSMPRKTDFILMKQ